MNDDDLDATHDWDFQQEKLLHESKSQDVVVAASILMVVAFALAFIFLVLVDWVGVI